MPDTSASFREPSTASLSDSELIAAARLGDQVAVGVLYHRHHPAALRLAKILSKDSSSAEDLAAEAFFKLIRLLRKGKGPDNVFLAYLLRIVHTMHVDEIRRSSRITLVDEHEDVPDDEEDFFVKTFEREAITRAFAALPRRWQQVLWHMIVEDSDRNKVAAMLGIGPTAVSSLLYRAREGLREAYLDQHLATAESSRCRALAPRLSSFCRGNLSPTNLRRVETHLATCEGCTTAVEDLRRVDESLGVREGGVSGISGRTANAPTEAG